MFQLQPENLGIDSHPQGAVAVLNSWREQTPLIEVARYGFTADSLKEFPETLLSDEQRSRMLATEFFTGDALYIRNALLTAAMARSVADQQENELDRVVALFEFALRTVTLQPPEAPQLPFPLYEILVLGQGSSDDRAWVFAALLKQQRIDSVILQAPDDPEARLVGVILEGDVYLFDTKLGLPIPRGDDPPGVRITRPATIREMQAHPEWWEAMTVRADLPYPWNAEQLAGADVLIISEEESWSGRMKQLETVLPSNSLCVLYDPMVESASLPSLAKRIAAGNPEWTPDKLKFWSHPLSVPARLQQMGPQAQQLGGFFQRFNAPLEIKSSKQQMTIKQEEFAGRLVPREGRPLDPNAQLVPSQQHLKTRTEQLMSRYALATSHYLRIRHLAVETPPAEMQDPTNPQVFQAWMALYQLAASDASYWSALCKVELNDRAAAANALQDYLKRFSQSDWASSARYVLALVQADLGRLPEARAAISNMSPDDPHRPGLDILMKRWDALPETKPAGDSSADPEK